MSRNCLIQHPEELLTYGAKHDYLDIVTAAAPLMLHRPLDEMLKKLPLKLAVTWVDLTIDKTAPSNLDFRLSITTDGAKFSAEPLIIIEAF